MIKLADAVFLWEDDRQSPNWGKFAVATSGGAFDYANSVGAVFGHWGLLSDVERAVGVLALQNWVMRAGLSWDVVHSECLKIEEYASWCEREEGPFTRAYACVSGVELLFDHGHEED